jgi:hypothetical protein
MPSACPQIIYLKYPEAGPDKLKELAAARAALVK